jgi:hypothetical protein
VADFLVPRTTRDAGSSASAATCPRRRSPRALRVEPCDTFGCDYGFHADDRELILQRLRTSAPEADRVVLDRLEECDALLGKRFDSDCRLP